MMKYFYTVRIKTEFSSPDDERAFFNEGKIITNHNLLMARAEAFSYFYSCLDIIFNIENSDKIGYKKLRKLIRNKTIEPKSIGIYFYAETEEALTDYDEDLDTQGRLIYNLLDMDVDDVDDLLWALQMELNEFQSLKKLTIDQEVIQIEFNTLGDDESDEIIQYDILKVDFPFHKYICTPKFQSEESELIKNAFELPLLNTEWSDEEKQAYQTYETIVRNIIGATVTFGEETKEEIKEQLDSSLLVQFLRKIGMVINSISDVPDYLTLLSDSTTKSFFLLNKQERAKRAELNLNYNPLKWNHEEFLKFINETSYYSNNLPQIEIYGHYEALLSLIENGESTIVEFKPSLMTAYDKVNKVAVMSEVACHSVLKTIGAFANTNGGYLFVGISDKNFYNNLQNDLDVLAKNYDQHKNTKDILLLEMDKLIKENFKNNYADIESSLITVMERRVMVVKVYPSRNPVFIQRNKQKEFYIRKGASSFHLYDVEQACNYCISHWNI
jgi:hypothetical protein